MNIDMQHVAQKAGLPLTIPAGPALIYLYRRFGPSNDASNYIEEVVTYTLPTLYDGAHLTIAVGSTRARFSCVATPEILLAITNDDPKMGGRGHHAAEVNRALAGTLEDMRSPVYVGRIYIDILGAVSNDEVRAREELGIFPAPIFRYAGWGFHDIAEATRRSRHDRD